MTSTKLERSRMRRKVSRTGLKSSEEGRPSSLRQQYADETTEEDLRKIAEKAPIIKLAYDELDRFSWNEKDLIAYEERIMDLRKEEGILAQKLDEGKIEGKIEVAKNLLKADISIDIISQTTGLPRLTMSQKVVNRTNGLVDYKELETNILSSIREGRPLTGKEGALTPFIKKLLEASLEGEIENHLLAESEENNRRNGRNGKTLRTSAGSFELLTPRDREGSFEPQIVKKRQTSLHPELETKILSTFASGMSYRDIASHVEEIYDHKISAAEISSITDKLLPIINEWRSRPLQSVYPIVFMDGMFFKVKEDGHCVSKCMYNILGIDQNGRKEVLGFYLAESEGANFWLGVLNNLKERGVEDILIACVDGLKSFPAAINSVFPSAEVQLCIVHQIRNSLKYVSSKDVKVFMNDLKKIYRASSKEIAENYLLELEEKWGEKYPLVIKSWQNNWENLSSYFKYSGPVRKLIYTTNPIEGLHRQIRKFTKTKGSFTSTNALYKQVYCAIKKVEQKWIMALPNWALTMSQLDIFFPDRLKIELN